ncbi:phospholipid methyltransferase [Verrucomicrobia bacterium LW23]|nr:phospholipid methyltransferase [Verrucomicrobia bacterium LW23]
MGQTRMNTSATIRERALFLARFLLAPRSTGSVIPSSRYLTRAIMARVDWSRCNALAELGAGTGVFTRGIAHHLQGRVQTPSAAFPVSSPSPAAPQVLVFEKDEMMRRRLALEFPHFSHHPDAAQLTTAVATAGITAGLDYVISGLPFTSLPGPLRDCILTEVSTALRPDGRFVLFQYTLVLKSCLARHFDCVSVDRVHLNLPPAWVIVCKKRA